MLSNQRKQNILEKLATKGIISHLSGVKLNPTMSAYINAWSKANPKASLKEITQYWRGVTNLGRAPTYKNLDAAAPVSMRKVYK